MRKSQKGILFIETRSMRHVAQRAREFEGRLNWPIMVACSSRNKGQFAGFHRMIVKDINSLSEYNQLLTSYVFWKDIPFKKVLVCQYDSGILRDGIEEFMQWDYIGAPWVFQEWGGNGGLSLRSVDVMKDLSYFTKWNSSPVNEDLFYCNIMHYSKTYKLAPREECEMFSVESIFKLGTLGYHFGEDSDRYLTDKQKEEILNQYGKRG